MAAANWTPSNVMSGTFGKVWLDGIQVFEAKACEAKVEIQQEPVKQTGRLVDGQKMTGYSGSGTLRLNKVFSRAQILLTDLLKQGINPEFTVMSEVKDPAALGAERIILTGVQLSTLPVIGWELGALLEEELPFTFMDWKLATKTEY